MVLNADTITGLSSFHRLLSIPSFPVRVDSISPLLQDSRYRWFTNYFITYIGQDYLLSNVFEGLLLPLRWLNFLPCRSTSPLLLLILFWLGFLNFEILGPMRGNVVLLNCKLFPQDSSIELEEHRQEIFMRSEEFLPAFYRLQYLLLNTSLGILVHE